MEPFMGESDLHLADFIHSNHSSHYHSFLKSWITQDLQITLLLEYFMNSSNTRTQDFKVTP